MRVHSHSTPFCFPGSLPAEVFSCSFGSAESLCLFSAIGWVVVPFPGFYNHRFRALVVVFVDSAGPRFCTSFLVRSTWMSRCSGMGGCNTYFL